MAAPAPAKGGPVDDRDVAEWKERVNAVLSQPSETINSKSPEGSQPWHNGFFSCLSPIDTCLITYCLPCVTFGKTHHRVRKDANLQGYEPINTSCLMFCASGCFGLHWVLMSMQRADIRQKYGLEGNCLSDIARACCCGLCDLVQQDKEAAHRAPLLANAAPGGDKTQYQAQGGMTYPAQ